MLYYSSVVTDAGAQMFLEHKPNADRFSVWRG